MIPSFVRWFKCLKVLKIAQLYALVIFDSVSLVKENLRELRENFKHNIPTLEGRETYNVRLRDFASATVWKPFLIALSLMFFFQFSGINVILHYTVDIFQSADSSVEEFQVTIFLTASLLASGQNNKDVA